MSFSNDFKSEELESNSVQMESRSKSISNDDLINVSMGFSNDFKRKEEEEVTTLSNAPQISSHSNSNISDTTIIGLQKANGSWLLEDMISLFNWEQSKIESSNPSSSVLLWVTTLTLSYLEKHFSHTRDLWNMVAKKATIFIKKLCRTENSDYVTIIEAANLFLSE